MFRVTHFVAEAIAEQVGLDNVTEDTDSSFQVFAVPCELNMDDIKEYVTAQHGGCKTSAQEDIETSFDDVELSSGILTEFYWEA